jgi:phosphate/phosphite/phosphonate ABC transporter binding protein
LSVNRWSLYALTLLSVFAIVIGCDKGQAPGAAQDAKPIRVGFMICNSRNETEARFKPLVAYLSKKLGRKVEAVTIDTRDFEQAVKDNKLDFTHTNSLLYVILNKHYGVEPLTGDMQGRYGNKTNGGIMVRADSPIKSLADLKGKRMVFGPMFAPTGYLSEYDYMLKHGFDPETDLAFYTIPRGSFKHEKVIYSLLFGAYDAASVPMLDFEQMVDEGKIDPADFRILAETEPIPYCTFGVTEHVDDALAAKFKQVLLSIKPEDTVEVDGERLKVLKAARLDGFADVTDKEYDKIRDMAKDCNMPPYQKF